MRIAAVLSLIPEVPEPDLMDWIARGWVLPQGEPPDFVFAEIDVARIRLVHDLRRVLALGDDDLPLVLALLDQVYDLRRRLAAVAAVAASQPPPLRAALLAALSSDPFGN